MMKRRLVLLRRHDTGWYFFLLDLRAFSLRFFTDCGDWFLYFISSRRTIRLSTAGCYHHKKPE